jgi:hypothetical protein
MRIGGNDIVILARRRLPVADIILRLVRHLWPACVVQRADESVIHDLTRADEWLYHIVGEEFFMYRDKSAAEGWMRNGGTPENQNTMLHFLIDTTGAAGATSCVTVVVGEISTELRQFLDDLAKTIRGPLELRPAA